MITVSSGFVPAAERIGIITRDGADGLAAHKLGTRGKPYSVRCVRDVLNASSWNSIMAQAMALQGELVSWTDDTGRTQSDQLVIDVDVLQTAGIRSAVGGVVSNSTLLVGWVFTCIDFQ